MVNLSTIRQSNKSILPSPPTGFVAVFVGATRGIGAGTLKAFVKNTGSGTFYVVGRSKAIFATQLAELESPNANVTIHFIQAEISLLRDVDAVCKTISARESKVDLLFMSAGLLRFFGPHCKCLIEEIDHDNFSTEIRDTNKPKTPLKASTPAWQSITIRA